MDILGQDKREGLGRKANSRVLLLLLMLLSAIFLLSSLYAAEASVFKKARETAMDAAAPVLSFFSGPIAMVDDAIGRVQDYFAVLEENKALREENIELRQWMREAIELRKTVAAFEALNVYRAPPEARPVQGFVIGEASDAYARAMLVNVGRRDGVAPGQAVVDDRGLVGHIVDAGAQSSRILLLTDIQSRIPVFVEGVEAQGILVGRTAGQPIIRYTQSSEPAAFEAGQRVLTSGAGGALPPGLPVGVIDSAEDGIAVIDLYANFARTRFVRVINYEFPGLDAPAPPEPIQDSKEDAEGAQQIDVSQTSAGIDNIAGQNVERDSPAQLTQTTVISTAQDSARPSSGEISASGASSANITTAEGQ